MRDEHGQWSGKFAQVNYMCQLCHNLLKLIVANNSRSADALQSLDAVELLLDQLPSGWNPPVIEVFVRAALLQLQTRAHPWPRAPHDHAPPTATCPSLAASPLPAHGLPPPESGGFTFVDSRPPSFTFGVECPSAPFASPGRTR